jgi:hypothetical protein
MLEHLLCKPYVTRIGSLFVGEVYDIQFGKAMLAIVQAAAPKKTQREMPYTMRLVMLADVQLFLVLVKI